MTDKPLLERRAFLNKFTAVVGGTAAIAVAAPVIHAQPVVSAPEPQPQEGVAKGYQRTEHVDKYYQLADF
jgi:hypothetical protein